MARTQRIRTPLGFAASDGSIVAMDDSVNESKRLSEANDESRPESTEIARRMELGLKKAFQTSATAKVQRRVARASQRGKSAPTRVGTPHKNEG